MKSNWANPDIAKNTRLGLAVLLGSIILCVWLVIEKFEIEIGQQDELTQNIPIAREVTAGELDALRRGRQISTSASPAAMDNQLPNILPLEPKKDLRNDAPKKTSVKTEPPRSINKDIELTGFESERNPAFAPVREETTQTIIKEGSFQPKFPAKDTASVLPDNSVIPRTFTPEPSGSFFRPIAKPPEPEVPAAVPQAMPVVETEANAGTEFVASGRETWWMIAQEVYGDGNYFKALYESNRTQFPDYEMIPEGAKIMCPPAERLDHLASSRMPNSAADGHRAPNFQPTYITQANDTLFDIARQQLGQASRFAEILRLNHKVLSRDIGHLTRLEPGILLKLPPQ